VHNAHGDAHGQNNIITVTDSTFTDNSTAIRAERGFQVERSTFTGNQTALISGGAPSTGGGKNKFSDNTVTSNDNGVSITPEAADSNSVKIKGNLFRDNSGYGLQTTVTAPATATITGNTFCNNSADVIYGDESVPDSIAQANTFTCDSLGSGDGGSSSSGGSSGGSTTPGPNSPPGVTTPPPRTSLPIGAVLGSGLMLVGGELVPVAPQRAPSGGKWTVSGEDFSLEFVPQVTDSGMNEGPAQTLRAPVGGQVQVTGDGYLGGSSVSVYLVPPSASGVSARASAEPIYLGDATVAAGGDFAVTFSVPASVDPGDYVLQINGWSQQASARSVNLNMGVYESLVARSVTEAAFFQGRSSELSGAGREKLRSMVAGLPKVRQDVRVEITAVSVSLDDVESDLRLAARRGRELRDYLSDGGVQGTYSVTIRTEDQLRSADKAPPLMVSSKGKPLTTVRITYDTAS
jgi:outer membrane protein OmpA-like peptidoglycan-associated protein